MARRKKARKPAPQSGSGEPRARVERSAKPARSPARLALAVVVVVVVAALGIGIVLISRPGGEHTAPASETATTGSHQRMLQALREIELSTDEHNEWLGERAARDARQELAALTESASDSDRFRALVRVAGEELRLGNERQAIDHYQAAYALLAKVGGTIDNEEVGRAVFRLGLAWMRYGETQNCALHHAAESCILPLAGGGIHRDPEGSREAIRYFLEILERTPVGHPLYVKTVWLLNLAYMTLGRHPQDVPADYLLPLPIFGSQGELPRFENIAPELGLDTLNLFGSMVVDDFDGDDHLDVFTTTFDTSESARFFRNNGDGTFTDRTREAGLHGLNGGLNAVQADYDNDGDLDLYVLRGAWLGKAGRHPNSLLRNRGDGVFEDVTFDAGLAQPSYPTQTASWADYDHDGDVDLYVGNERNADIEAPCQLFRNNGDGTFTDVATQAGVDNRSFVKGVVWGDYDGDRFPDLYVSTLGGANRLYRNNRDGTFSDVAPALGVSEPGDSFPVWFWDFDNDGALDLYVSSYRGVTDAVSAVAASYFGMPSLLDLPHLYRGDGQGGFENVASSRNLTRLHLTMGSNFGDLDGDGWLDFYLGTGYPDYESLMPNVMYKNDGGQRFLDVTLAGGFGHLQKGHAVSFADFDSDGDLDVFEQMGGAFPGDRYQDAVYRNPGFAHRWIGLLLEGVESNRAAIGARIHAVVLEAGAARSIYRHVGSGGSFGANPLRQTIGVGNADRLERLEIYWPTTDLTQVFQDVPLDSFFRIVEGDDELEGLHSPAAVE